MATYAPIQLRRFFDRISLPAKHRHESIRSLSASAQLSTLASIHAAFIVHVPFENLSIHYSQQHAISIDPEFLYNKIVARTDTKRGGYCMENNTVMAGMLRAMGFDLYSVGARVYDGGRWTGFGHMCNIITIDSIRYLVDTGFGPAECTRPLALPPIDASTNSVVGHGQTNIAPAEMRLNYRAIEIHSREDMRVWVYETRNSPTDPWTSNYAFVDIEFSSADYEVMNLWTSTSPRTFFTYSILCARMIRASEVKRDQGYDPSDNHKEKEKDDEDDEDPIAGVLIVMENVKRRVKGENEIVEEKFATEDERVKALEKWFGIRLDISERRAIGGRVSMIRPPVE